MMRERETVTGRTEDRGHLADPKGFDYIIVGSGAGGGPLASRLAREGCRVLVIEAGPDHVATDGPAREVSLVPSFHGLSTEHPALSWKFFVEHYSTPPTGPDPKRHPKAGDPPNRQGIFYPRSSGIGGCTVHNAMITIAGPDSDWDDLADFVGDDTWRGGAMRAYFQKLERNEYSPLPTPPPSNWLGRARDLVKWLFGRDPDHSSGRHGFEGWLHTSLTDIALGLSDRQLVKMLKAALWRSVFAGLDRAWTWVWRFFKGTALQGLDPNHSRTQAESPEGVVQIPLAVCGSRTTIHQNSETPFVIRGRRSSPREFLLETQARYPENLLIQTNSLVTSVIFDDGPKPRAVGVRVLRGERLYRADENHTSNPGRAEEVYVRQPHGEVILCGGAFNTPQLLMLSGIGDQAHLSEIAASDQDACTLRGRENRPLRDDQGPRRIHLPGVGRNLQDRYEVTLISEMKRTFSLLDDALFKLPGNGVPVDRHLKEWRADGTGLYTSNGSVLGMLKRSNPDLDQPDLFIFGIPLPFKGYEAGYSGVGDDHGHFTWAILKGHTRNSDGTVKLQSASPLDPPLINFHYFNETSCPGRSDKDPDVLALVEGVKYVRSIAPFARGLFKVVRRESHPGLDTVPNDDASISAWIRREAWGHHACATCRMGPDGDPDAVLDSRFRVREVSGLRVVDASIFPKIPGYFVVTNIYMASEKAADVVLEDLRHARVDSPLYPHDLRAREVAALSARRKRVVPDPSRPDQPAPTPEKEQEPSTWSDDVTGLGLSGGGIRSATFGLGVLQALARHHWLRRIDFLSTVSGGGYIGSFLGRWFDRLRTDLAWGGEREPQQPVPDRIERELIDHDSQAVRWLRKHGNYIAPAGTGDERLNMAVFVRNFLTVHFVVGLFLFTLFGAANAFRYGALDPMFALFNLTGITAADLPLSLLLKALIGPFFSPWFVVVELVLLLMVLPRIVGYWIVSQDRHERFSFPPLLIMFILSGLLLFLGIHNGLNVPLVLLGLAPLTAIISVELAWRRGRIREEAIGRGNIETQRLRTRNYLTYDLGLALVLAGAALGFALVDTTAHALHQAAIDNQRYVAAFTSLMAAVAMLVPILRYVANFFARDRKPAPPSTFRRLFKEQVIAGFLAIVMASLPLVAVSFVAHAAFGGGAALERGLGATGLALLISLIVALPSALVIVNRSSLSQTYAARLARAYLGASNPLRHHPQGANVTEVMAGDDVASIRDYKPYNVGGPLHLLNLTVTQTVDFTSQRGNRDRKGENLAVSSIGMSIGQRWHSAWADRPDDTEVRRHPRKRPARLEPLGHTAGLEHPLVDETGRPAQQAEMLSLRQWMAISGAALGPGGGQTTKLGTALLFGLANLRTGYWWDSGITEAAREGYPPLTFLQRGFYVLQSLFLAQTLLIHEWVARFPGPWERFWFISDGGFFERMGGYELIRRGVPRIIICDASADPNYEMGGFADLMRKVLIDFNARIEPFDPSGYEAAGIPAEVQQHLGSLEDLKAAKDTAGNITGPSKKHAALFWVVYDDAPRRRSLLLYLKATVTGDEGPDIEYHHTTHPEFPHEGTVDQAFDEAQWEGYRGLGEHIALPLVARGGWFWSVPL